jgi:hypothetical protein
MMAILTNQLISLQKKICGREILGEYLLDTELMADTVRVAT